MATADKQAKAPLQRELAKRLNISQAMTSRLIARGMPKDVAGARKWRREQLNPAKTKALPDERVLRHRLLAANVALRETQARREGVELLPSDLVERALQIAFAHARAACNAGGDRIYAAALRQFGESALRGTPLLPLLCDWGSAVHAEVVNGIFHGLQRELPVWGRRFLARYRTQVRGNFPDRPCPWGEPRELDDAGADGAAGT